MLQPAPPVALAVQVITDELVNLEAESAVLSALLIDNGHYATACAGMAPDDFSDPLHQRLFAAIGDMIAPPRERNFFEKLFGG